jgi:integrase/recombinase XerD
VFDCTPHRFRHALAKDLLAKGVRLEVVQQVMGHSDVKTTMGYTRIANHLIADALALR